MEWQVVILSFKVLKRLLAMKCSLASICMCMEASATHVRLHVMTCGDMRFLGYLYQWPHPVSLQILETIGSKYKMMLHQDQVSVGRLLWFPTKEKKMRTTIKVKTTFTYLAASRSLIVLTWKNYLLLKLRTPPHIYSCQTCGDSICFQCSGKR